MHQDDCVSGYEEHMIRNILGRLHCSNSYITAYRTVRGKLREPRKMPVRTKRALARCVFKNWQEMRQTYAFCITGRAR